MYEPIQRLASKFQLNFCGEGGEYETLVLDSPLFKYGRLKILDSDVVYLDKALNTAHLKIVDIKV